VGAGLLQAGGRQGRTLRADRPPQRRRRRARQRPYDLRHTCASLLIREGASIKAVQKHLGHATAAITLDVYGHLFPDELPELAGRLERLRGQVRADLKPQRSPEVAALR
jgi:integrase